MSLPRSSHPLGRSLASTVVLVSPGKVCFLEFISGILLAGVLLVCNLQSVLFPDPDPPHQVDPWFVCLPRPAF